MLNFIKNLKNKLDSSGLNRKIMAVSMVLMLLPLIALADNVTNDVAIGGTDTFTLGGSTTVSYKIVHTGGDSQPGCNAADGSAATVTINTPTGVSADPGLLTFTACNVFKSVNFTASAAGDYDITVSVTDSGPGTYNTIPGAFTLYVLAPADNTAPTTSIALDPSTPNGNNGWYTTNVHVTVSASDNTGGSGVAETRCVLDPVSPPASFDNIPPGCTYTDAGVDVTAEGQHTIYAASKDNAGNKESPLKSAAFKIDKTAPVITITSPTNGETYTLNQAVASSYTCSDSISDIATCSGPVPNGANFDTSSVGYKSFTVTAEDNAGNHASLTHNYNVIYNWNGFFQPVDNFPTLNTVKAGSAVPVKFSLGGDQGLNIFDGYPISMTIVCDSGELDNDSEETVTAGQSSLSYDATANQYIYVWKTKKTYTVGSCRQLHVKLIDGTDHIANFKFK